MKITYGLRTRILIPIGVIIFAVLGTSTFLHIQALKQNYFEAIRWRSDALAQGILGDIIRKYGIYEVADVRRFLGALSLKCMEIYKLNKDKNVAHVAVIDESGVIVAHNNRELWNTPVQNPELIRNLKRREHITVSDETAYHTFIPIFLKQNVFIGTIDIGFPKTVMDQKIYSILADSLKLLTVFLMIAFWVILFIIKRKIVSPIVRTIEESDRGIGEIFLSSEEIASLSQMLAQGTSEHAASSETSSSALEEVSSMIRKNADNTGQADDFMKEVGQVIGKANDSMRTLTDSMKEIIRVSQETSQVVRIIDGIAFQTNLLALNASVEAARAGEAGAGFAVVAGEVKNLAMRTAEAARNTSDLIERTLKKIQTGGDIVSETCTVFGEVTRFSDKIEKLIISVAETSEEQALRIEQISKAFAEIDKVARNNAAIADKSAFASEKMKDRGEMIKILINELRALIGKK